MAFRGPWIGWECATAPLSAHRRISRQLSGQLSGRVGAITLALLLVMGSAKGADPSSPPSPPPPVKLLPPAIFVGDENDEPGPAIKTIAHQAKEAAPVESPPSASGATKQAAPPIAKPSPVPSASAKDGSPFSASSPNPTPTSKAAANNASAERERRIVFNFNNAPWDQVLTRFAELADLSLMMDVRPPGAFSYSDQKPRTVSEALDILNGVLLAKDFVLLRNNQFLALVPMDRPLPSDLVPRVSPSDLARLGKNELVSVMLTLKHADPSAVAKELKGVLSKHGQVVGVGKLKLLKVTDLAGHLREAVPLIHQLDDASAPKPAAAAASPAPKIEQIVQLKVLDVTRVEPLLKAVFGDIAKIAPGANSKQLIVVATAADHKRITDLLAKIDVPVASDQATVHKAYPLERGNAKTVAESLQQLFPHETTGARVTGDERNNALLIEATEAHHQKIKGLLGDLDAQRSKLQFVEKIYRPKRASAAALAPTLQTLYARSATQVAIHGDGDAIVVRALAPEQEKVARLIEELDQAEQEGPLEEAAIKLTHASPVSLASSLQLLYPTTRTQTTFTGDAASRLLIVRGPKTIVERVKRLVEDIDLPTGLGNNVEMVFRPKQAKPADLLKTLQSLYPTSSNVMVFAAPDRRSLVLSTPRELQTRVRATLEMLDREPEALSGVVEKVYPLRHASATTLSANLQQLFPAADSGAQIIADNANNVLVVSAPDSVHERIGKLIPTLDVSPTSSLEVNAYRARHLAPATLASTLTSLFGGAKGVKFAVDARTQSVLITAPADVLTQIEAALKRIDVPPTKENAASSDELYKLKFAQAAELAETLRKLYPPDETPVKVAHDAVNQTVIVTAPAEIQAKIKQLIDRVDVPTESRLEEKIYTPQSAAAGQVLSTLQTMFNDGKATFTLSGERSIVARAPAATHKKIEALLAKIDQAPEGVEEKIIQPTHVPAAGLANTLSNLYSNRPGFRVSVDASGKGVVVIAPPALHKKIAELVGSLDKPSDAGGEVRTVYRIEHSTAYYIASTLQTLFPANESGAKITYDSATNVIVVVGSPQFQQKIKALVAEIDVDPKRHVVETIYEPKHLAAPQVVDWLRQTLSNQLHATVSLAPGGRRVVILAPPAAQARVERLLKEFDQPTAQDGEIRKVYPLEHANSAYVASALQTLFPAADTGARISYDATNNALLVSASSALHEKIKGLLPQLDVDPKRNLLEKSYATKHVPAPQAGTVLREALASMPNTTVTISPRRDRIVVIAPATVLDRAARLLSSLDQPPPENEKTERRVYKMRHGYAAGVASALQTLYSQANYPATVTYEQSNNVVIVDAPAELQAKMKDLVDELDQPSGGRVDKVYSIAHRKSDQLIVPLRTLLASSSGAQVVSGPDRKSLVVSANPADHERVADFLKRFDTDASDVEPAQKLYRLRHTRAAGLANSMSSLFRNEPGTSITHDEPNNALVVNARPEVHQKVQNLIDEFDKPGLERPTVERVVSLRHGSAEGALRALREVFPDPELVRLSADSKNNTLLVRSPPDLAQKINETLTLLDQPKRRGDREVDVLPLYKLEPYAAESAINAMFGDLPTDERPSIESVFDPPQIIARATPDQLRDIRSLLAKMGEGGAAGSGSGNGPRPNEPTTRTLRIARGDPRALAESIEQLWPRLRRNPLHVVLRARVGDLSSNNNRAGDDESKNGSVPAKANNPSDPTKKPAEARPKGNEAKNADRPSNDVEKVPVLTKGAAPNLPGDPKVPVVITTGNNRLIVSSQDLEALRLVEELASSLTEVPSNEQGEFTIFYLEHANAIDVAKTIDESFNGKERDGGNGRSRTRRPDRVRVVADASANAIIARGSPIDLVSVARLIESIDDDKLTSATAKQPRLIPLKNTQADDVMAVLKGIYTDYLAPGTGGPLNLPGFTARTGEKGNTSALSIGVDARSNQLVVSAPDQLFKQIQTLVNSLEGAAGEAGRAYRVLPLKNANPMDVRDALELLLDRETPTGSNAPRRRSTSSGGSTSPRPRRSRTGSSAPRSSSTTSSPLPEDVAKEEARESTEVTTITATRSGVSVSRDRPKLLRPLLEIDVEQDGNDARAPGLPVAADDAPESGPVILPASFQAPPSPVPGDGASPLASALAAVSPSVEIRALPDLGVLLLTGNERDIKALADVVSEIERIAKAGELKFEIYPLKRMKAAALADILSDLYRRLLEARGLPTAAQAQAEVIPLAQPNALLIAAPKDDIARLMELAGRLDNAGTDKGTVQIYRLEHARAMDISTTIEEVYRRRVDEGELAPEVVIEADRRSNSLVVRAAPRDLEEVTALIKQLDVGTTASVNEMRVFPLRHTAAQELAAVLEDAIRGRGAGAGSGVSTTGSMRDAGPALQLLTPDSKNLRSVDSGILENVRITANRRANTIIVSAPTKTMDLIAALVKQLDVLPEALAEIKVFTLVNSDATTMVQTLRSLFVQLQTPGGSVALSPTTLPSGDGSANPLVELTFSIDERTNSILASGTKQQLQVVEAIILRLDGSDIEERKTEVYRLRNAPANTVADSLSQLLRAQNEIAEIQEGVSLQQQLEREIVVVPESITNSLLISSTPRFYKRLVDLIEKLDEAPPQVVIQVLIVQVDLNNTREFGAEVGLQDSILFQRGIFPGGALLNSPFTPTGVTGTSPASVYPGIPGFGFNSNSGTNGSIPQLGNNPQTSNLDQVGSQGLSNFNLGRSSQLGFSGLVLSASSESVSFLLRALSLQTRVEVLSRPQIMTLDNQQAFIQVGQQVPVLTGSTLVANLGVQNQIAYVDTGIILQVLPKINPDGSVVMRVDPEISALAPANDPDSSVQIAANTFARSINTTRAQTTVSATDGQTAVIGGLIRKEQTVITRKVPWLGDIPVLQFAFRFDQRRTLKREILIFLTPHVVRSEVDAERVKQVEAARIDWCLSEVEKVTGDLGLPTEVTYEMPPKHQRHRGLGPWRPGTMNLPPKKQFWPRWPKKDEVAPPIEEYESPEFQEVSPDGTTPPARETMAPAPDDSVRRPSPASKVPSAVEPSRIVPPSMDTSAARAKSGSTR